MADAAEHGRLVLQVVCLLADELLLAVCAVQAAGRIGEAACGAQLVHAAEEEDQPKRVLEPFARAERRHLWCMVRDCGGGAVMRIERLLKNAKSRTGLSSSTPKTIQHEKDRATVTFATS